MLGDAGKDVGEPGLWVDIIELGGDDEAIHDGCALATAIGACEQPRLSSKSYCPFILPMSGRSWKFITDGIRILAARCKSGRSRIELTAAM